MREVRVTQPVLMARGGFGKHLRWTATFDFEGLTIKNGELAPGDWGEGFVDRRHPHTYIHEAMVAATFGRGSDWWDAALSAGKGFVPFGSDDPMNRPILRYPVNHHLAQILERAVLIGQLRAGPVVVEGAVFNGDEPERPGQWPAIKRFADSWSARALITPVAGVELQGSVAAVHSPEHRPGAGGDQRKASISLRGERGTADHRLYALVEWARTSELDGFFIFHSWLGEGAFRRGRHRLEYRLERTDRPEEERLTDLFRSLRPHLENSIVGISRWTIQTLGYGIEAWQRDGATITPFAEVSYGRMSDVGHGLFHVDAFYGQDHFWSLSIGARLGWQWVSHRMGRYGLLVESDHAHH